MSYLGGMDSDERGMMLDLVNTFVMKLNVERRLTEDLTRQLDAANERIKLLEAAAYGLF
jgi:hypothetical protein